MTEREKQSGRNRPFAFLHQLADNIVDRGDMIGIDGVAKPEHIGKQRSAEQRRMRGQRRKRPGPDRHIERK